MILRLLSLNQFSWALCCRKVLTYSFKGLMKDCTIYVISVGSFFVCQLIYCQYLYRNVGAMRFILRVIDVCCKPVKEAS